MIKQQKWIIPVIIVVIILITVIAGFFLSRPQGNELPASLTILPDGLEITGLSTQSAIPTEATFQIVSDFAVNETELRALIEVVPEIKYTLTGSGKNWTFAPDEPLWENTIYTFRVKNAAGTSVQSFAFQTKSDLLIESVYPENESFVDIATGIDVKFNASNVDMSSHFELLPKVAGSFQTNAYGCTFIPAAPLEPGSIYRVTIKAGLASPDGIGLKEDYTFTFATTEAPEEERPYLEIAGPFVQSGLPGDDLALPLWADRGKEDVAPTLSVTVHKFPGINSFSNEVRAYNEFYDTLYGKKRDYVVKTNSLEEIAAYESPLIDDMSGSPFVPLPTELSEGHYVVTVQNKAVEGDPVQVQALYQLANASLYTQSNSGESVFWVNDPITGLPMSGAQLILDPVKATASQQTADVGENGVVQLITGKQEGTYLTLLRDGSPIWFNHIPLQEKEDPTLEETFYSTFYTDREIYQPDDTMQFWGTLSPRRPTSTLPTEVTISLRGGYPRTEAANVKVAVNPDGSYSGSLSLSGMKREYYSIAVTAGGEDAYYTKSLSLMEYTKPAYRLTTTTDKPFYYYNEKPQISIVATYYDGTPVSGGKLRINGYPLRFGENGTEELLITLDQAGKAKIEASFYKEAGSMSSWSPTMANYWIGSADEQDVNVNVSGRMTLLPSKVAASLEQKTEGELTVQLASFKEAGLEQPDQPRPLGNPVAKTISPEEDYLFKQYQGAAVNLPFQILVRQNKTEKVQSGSYYDAVNKKTVPVYRYTTAETLLQTIKGTTENGVAVLKDLPYKDTEDTRHWYELRFDGGVIGEVNALDRRPLRRNRPDTPPRYSFFADEAPTVPLGGSFEIGLYNNGEAVPNKGRILCSVYQNQILNLGVFHGNSQTLELTETELPEVYIAGGYFDGRYTYMIENDRIPYDYSERTLKVEVSTDKESYKPGDTANVTLKVTDAAGKPAAAAACIGVVDESVFALEAQELDLAGQLYRGIYGGNLTRTVSNTSPIVGGETQKLLLNTGGGMADMASSEAGFASGRSSLDGAQANPRETFADTALFLPVTVDASGVATLQVKLPDNITGWRLTAAAVTTGLSAGDGKSEAIASLPFYLRPLVSDQYLVGDDFAVSVGVGGDALLPESKIDYRLQVTDASGKELHKVEQSGRADERMTFQLGKLAEGGYTMTLSGSSDKGADAVKLPFSVIRSGLTVPVIKTMPVSEVVNVKAARYPIQVSVFDEKLTSYMAALSWLSAQEGERTEIFAAAYRARLLYQELVPEADREAISRDGRLDEIQRENGGVRALPAAQPDAMTTTQLLLAAPELVSTGQAKAYLRGVLADPAASQESRVMAYTGLAALKEPVLLDLKRLLRQETDSLTVTQKLYLSAGLAVLGDSAAALELYDGLSSSRVQEGKMYYIEADGTAENRMSGTAAALTLTSLLGHEDAQGYLLFLQGQTETQRGQIAPVHLAVLTYCETYSVPSGVNKGKISYLDRDGKLQEIELDQDGLISLSFGAGELEKAQLKTVSGKLSAAVSYLGYPEEKPADNGHKLTVQRTYTPVDGEEIKTGNRVKVTVKLTFDESAPEGCYHVTDIIPAGLRYLSNDGYQNSADGYYSRMENEGQTMRGYVYRSKPEVEELDEQADPNVGIENALEERIVEAVPSGDGKSHPNEYTLVYYTSAVLPGEFIGEGVYVTPYSEGISARGERETIVITH